MLPRERLPCTAVLCLSLMVAAAQARAQTPRPKVRAITAFIRIDLAQYQDQVASTLVALRSAKAEYERSGYEVESLRITIQPFSQFVADMSDTDVMAFCKHFDDLSTQNNFDANLGPAMLNDTDDPHAVELLSKVLSATKNLEASVIVAGDDGLHPKAISASARLLKYVEVNSVHSQGNFNFTATAMLLPYGPFYPGSYHLGTGHQFSIGLESANVVEAVFAAHPGNYAEAGTFLAKELGRYAMDCERIAQRVALQTGWTYAGIDATPAPLGTVSIGSAIEKLIEGRFGSSGTLTAASTITRAVRSLSVKQVGYTGLMVPVLEDATLAQRWTEGAYGIDSLLAYSAVCGTGLDTVPLPGDVSERQLGQILSDMASLAVKWRKPLSARLLPVAGKRAHDRTEFDDPFLVNAALQPLP